MHGEGCGRSAEGVHEEEVEGIEKKVSGACGRGA
jgi:hypothetical protein